MSNIVTKSKQLFFLTEEDCWCAKACKPEVHIGMLGFLLWPFLSLNLELAIWAKISWLLGLQAWVLMPIEPSLPSQLSCGFILSGISKKVLLCSRPLPSKCHGVVETSRCV